MSRKPFCPLLLAIVAGLLVAMAPAQGQGGVRITLPKRSKPTPVQSLNREGVKAVQKHNYEKAKKLFYKAYLLDPNDPFTLNNLGYISELEGKVDRAERFYALAEDQSSDAIVDQANEASAEGKPVTKVAGSADDLAMQVNRDNVQAISLLLKDRAPEADILLQKALVLDPKNPFTLNNMGFTKEKEGEFQAALGFYMQSAQQHSPDPVVVTVDKNWRGKPISEIAENNAKKLRKQLSQKETPATRVARLNLQGVSAINRNEPDKARDVFQQAYKLNPNDAFTLNNMGYLAEMEGDRETADFYYDKAREAQSAKQKVTVATRKDMEGRRLSEVADTSDTAVQQQIEAKLAERRREGGPVRLMRRDRTPVIEPDKPVTPAPTSENRTPASEAPTSGTGPEAVPGNSQPQGGLLMPLPENEQPGNPDNAAPAQPSSGQPGAQPTPAQPAPSQPAPSQPAPAQPNPPAGNNSQPDNGGLIMPLPDDQQPANADKAKPAQPQNAPQAAPQQPAPEGGIMEPLPDNQQPPNAGPTPDNNSKPPQK
ncbi:MAG TPA: hypothetical protein VFA76_15140 [Terriglobales bacterium]|nr:hypothetical protein [Terriglobales bacterium]